MSTHAARAPVARDRPMRLPRTTGALSGFLIILLGIWGALIPLIGPYFHYAFGSYQTWHVTSGRIWFDIVPGAVALIGGWMLLTSAHRTSGLLGGWLAVAAGVWFAVGPAVSLLWRHGGYPIGQPTGPHARIALEQLGYFYGLGVAIATLAAFAMGRYFSRPRIAEEPMVAAATAAGAAEERHAVRREERHAAVADEPGMAGGTAAGAGTAAAADRPAGGTRMAAADEPGAAGGPGTAAANEPVAAADRPVGAAPATGRRRQGGLFGRLFGRRA